MTYDGRIDVEPSDSSARQKDLGDKGSDWKKPRPDDLLGQMQQLSPRGAGVRPVGGTAKLENDMINGIHASSFSQPGGASPGAPQGQPDVDEMIAYIDALEVELRDTKDMLNERLSDDEVTQIHFRAGQNEVEELKKQVNALELKMSENSMQYKALQHKAAAEMGEAMEETASLRTQLQAARAQTADAEERLVQALSSAAMQASGGHPTASSDHFSSIVTQQLQNQAAEITSLRQQREAQEQATTRHKHDLQALTNELMAARKLQEDLLVAADEERAAREKANQELQEAQEHTARMQALGDAALEETGTVSEQVFALQEDLMEKGHLVAALEQERQQILQELEGYRARVGKEAGQDESKALMDMATTELQKLKTHNVALQEELSKKQLQLEVFVAAEEEREMRERETDLQTFAASFSASMSAADRLSQLEADLREEVRMRQHCEHQVAGAQQELEDRAGELNTLEDLRQQQATQRQLELDLIEAQERLKESDMQLREAHMDIARLSAEVQQARDELQWVQQGYGSGHMEGGVDLAVLEASLHQVEMELSREREQWAQRQEMHQAEAQSLRLQLQRLHEQQDMLAQSAQPPQHKALLDRIYQMEGELELVTQEKFALHERLLQSQAARAALSDQQPAHAGTDAAVLHEQLQRTKDAKSRAEAAHQEARALLTQASDQARQVRADMLVMAKQLIALHSVVDETTSSLDSIAEAQRLQRAAELRRSHAVAFETQRLQLALDDAYAQLQDARAASRSSKTLANKHTSQALMTQELLSGAIETVLRKELVAIDSASAALAGLVLACVKRSPSSPRAGLAGGQRHRHRVLMPASLHTNVSRGSAVAAAARAWQGGLVASRSSLSSAPITQVAHVLPKGDFMELAVVSSPTARRLLAITGREGTTAYAATLNGTAGGSAAEGRGGEEQDLKDRDKQTVEVADACDTLLGLRTSLLLLIQMRAAAVKFARRRAIRGIKLAVSSLQRHVEKWQLGRHGAALLLARVHRRFLTKTFGSWAHVLAKTKQAIRAVRKALARRSSVLAGVKKRAVLGWKARAWRLSFRRRQVWLARHRRVLRIAMTVIAGWKSAQRGGCVRDRSMHAMRLRRHLQLSIIKFLEWKYQATGRAGPSSSALKVIVTKYTCGAVRDALTEWNTHVSWQWSSEFRRFWNSMRRLDKLLVRSMLQWKRLLSRSVWFHHAASSRARNRVAPSYVRSSFYGWEKVTFPPREMRRRSQSRGADDYDY